MYRLSCLGCLLLGVWLVVGASPAQAATAPLGPQAGEAVAASFSLSPARLGPHFGPRPSAEQAASADWNRRVGIGWTALGGGLVLSSAWWVFYVPYRAAALIAGTGWLASLTASAIEFAVVASVFGVALVFGVLFLIQGIRYLRAADRLMTRPGAQRQALLVVAPPGLSQELTLPSRLVLGSF